MSIRVPRLGLALLAVMVCCLVNPRPAAAIALRSWHAKTAPHGTMFRKTPEPPKHRQVQSSGVDGTITLISLINSRRQDEGARVRDSRASGLAGPQTTAGQTPGPADGRAPRSVDSLPPHWASTHLSV